MIAPRVAEKNKENDDDEDHTLGKVVQHCVCCVMDQIISVQVRDNFNARGKDVFIQAVNNGVNAFQRCCRIRAFPQKYDPFNYVAIICHHAILSVHGFPYLTEADLGALRNHGDVFDTERRPILRFDYRLLDVRDIPNQSHRAHINLLRALLDKTPARVRVGIRELLFNLRQTQAVGDQLIRVDANLVFASDAAKR